MKSFKVSVKRIIEDKVNTYVILMDAYECCSSKEIYSSQADVQSFIAH